MANLISDWHHSEFICLLKSKGIKPRRTPLPGQLLVLPCKLLVFSAVMQTAYAAAIAGPVPPLPPVSWVVAVGGVRGLLSPGACWWLGPPLPPKRKPPDPLLDGEGRCSTVSDVGVNQVGGQESTVGGQCSLVSTVGVDDFKIVSGFALPLLDVLHKWDDLHNHVLQCCLSSFAPSFGPLGLLATSADSLHVICDTGASLTVSHCREDFITYEEQSGLVLHGLTEGTPIKGVGIVEWLVECGSQTISLKLRALHVPAAGKRLLCPQQVRKELFPGMPEGRIGDEAVF